ncbi:TrmO family methyltransferase domain-containing protein [Paenibacillus aceti]|uniref:HTH merR-type domain-containing protein n=1 Tax=Paenibacillus aceti TaxID=1820010 RepID=A0ABQ1W469_9BACL|nr:TrmO family methyltransferase [Paenibacillus aceti]GGG12974.1 hypothetical protein GCM10010913_38450 [Paenibacillus aceti]
MTIFRIGEFSKLTQVSIRMLRYYDETGLLKPAQIDNQTGYRHYSVEQIPVLQKIIMLRDLGCSVAEIAKQYNFILKQVPSYPVVSLRRVEIITQEKIDVDPHAPGIALYHDQEFKETNVDVEVCSMTSHLRNNPSRATYRRTEQVELMACAMVYGPFENIKGAYLSFAQSPIRPNPIALTASQIMAIDDEEGVIQIAYIDANDHSPVLDLKPYTPSLDRVERPEVPLWCRDWPKSMEESAAFDWSQVFNF